MVVLGIAVAALVASASAGAGSGHVAAKRLSLPHVGESSLDSRLVKVADSRQSHGAAAALASARSQSLTVSDGKVRVIVQARAGRLAAARSAVLAAGGQIEEQADGLLQANVAPASLRQLAASGAVANVAPPAVPVEQAVDEGVQATGADVWQAAGYDGTGVKVAIIDLGLLRLPGAPRVGAPASVTTDDRCSGNLTAAPADGGTEHGTAVAEIVHQMAPGRAALL